MSLERATVERIGGEPDAIAWLLHPAKSWRWLKAQMWEPKRVIPRPRGFWIGDTLCSFSMSPPDVREGDGFHEKMQSGKTMLYRVLELRRPGDPGDQNFVRCERMRYVEDSDRGQ